MAEEVGEKIEPSSSMIIELFIFRCLCSEFCRTAFIQIYITFDIYCVKKSVNKGPFCGSQNSAGIMLLCCYCLLLGREAS